MNPNFQPDDQAHPNAKMVVPEAYDASEQQFAASLEAQPESSIAEAIAETAASASGNEILNATPAAASCDASAWRKEIADRVNKYRRKSPREPRYPSLQLKFETWAPMRAPDPPPVSIQPVALESVALKNETQLVTEVLPEPETIIHEPIVHAPDRPHLEVASNVIEFPRFTAEPPSHHDKLAEPVLDQLRILEAPEFAPAPPALGGIHIEQVEERPQERRPGFEVPLQSASIVRRTAAAIADAVIVGGSLAAFGYIFFRLSAPVLPLTQWIAVGAALAGVFWVAYQYSFLVHTGSTLGLRFAGLRIARFDGTAPSRALRRWRVLTSVLSAISLGLGYLWCFLDEDQLCWHDRITKTHLAPKNPVHTNDED
jgi:uncharacterized RDD family membrane protein YckC